MTTRMASSGRGSVLLIQRHAFGSYRSSVAALVASGRHVTAVTRPYSLDGHDPALWTDLAVCAVDDDRRLREVVDWLISSRAVTHVVTLHERMVEAAAEARARWHLGGMDPATARRFRDKVVMKAAVAEAGIRVPWHVPITGADDLSVLDRRGGAMVIKPIDGLGAQRIEVVRSSPEAVLAWRRLSGGQQGYELEEFIAGRLLHVDSVVADGRVVFSSVSEYLSRPLDFARYGSNCSVTLEAGALADRMRRYAERVLAALGIVDGVTHLEAFVQPDDEIVFCEAAARPGGGGIGRVVQDAYGIDLNLTAVLAQCGEDTADLIRCGPPPIGVWASIGIYPGTGRRELRLPAAERAALGVVDIIVNPYAGCDAPAHSVDFAQVLIVRAPTRADLLDRYLRIQRLFGIEPAATVGGEGAGHSA
jgi:hypothetical protein